MSVDYYWHYIYVVCAKGFALQSIGASVLQVLEKENDDLLEMAALEGRGLGTLIRLGVISGTTKAINGEIGNRK